MPGLNMGIIKSLKLPLPPLGVQREFKMRANSIGAIRRAQAQQMQHIDALFASLQHRAFRGEL